jgi:hypothetical protein
LHLGTAALLGLACFSGPAPAQTAPAPAAPAPEPTAEQWRAFALQDVQAAYDSFVANHPGMHDHTNPGFPAQLKRGRDAGLRYAEKAASSIDYGDALGAFSSELSDGHAQVFPISSQSAGNVLGRQWPGFVAAWRGKQLLVHTARQSAPVAKGSVILDCDGKNAQEFVQARLLAGYFRPKEPGQWWFRAPRAFTASPTFMQFRPERCTFLTPAGKRKAAKLTWSAAPEDLNDLLTAASDGERTPIGLTEPRTGIFLLGLPDFQPNEDAVKAYRALYETLRARRGELMKAKAVVLDLRHNNGGSSAWPRQAAQAIWGDQPVNTAMAHYSNRVRIWWRASQGNTDYMKDLETQVRGNGNVAVADSIKATGEGMRAALERGEPYYVEGSNKPPASELPPIPASDFTTPVYVITPGRCASACLDAVDVFTRFKNVTLIGAPTSADSTYMEVRTADLPSGRGRIVIPNKMWLGRPRASGQVYEPNIVMTGVDWSTAAFLDRIEKDLASKKPGARRQVAKLGSRR